jgi:hypothetical protein
MDSHKRAGGASGDAICGDATSNVNLATAAQATGMVIAVEDGEVNLNERWRIYGKPKCLEPERQLPAQ